MENVTLKYGKENISFSLPDQTRKLHFEEPVHGISKEGFVKELYTLLVDQEFIGDIALVVADKTRLCGYDSILPWVVEALETRGVSKDQITFFIAYGTHPRQTDEECYAAYGEVYRQYRFVHHNCHETEKFTYLGKTARGTEVRVRKDVIESEIILTIGAVSHHYFAGYGGARKLLFPGLAEKEAVYANHRLYLDKENMQLSVGCWPGKLEGNPLAEDLKEIHEMMPGYLSIHAVLDSKGVPAKYYFGKTYSDFLSVCKILDTCYKPKNTDTYDLVLASAGGYPKDINIIQVHKAIHNAANFVKDGGVLILLAQCIDGVGSETFLPYFDQGKWSDTFCNLLENYVGNGGTALAMMEKTNRISICLVTELSSDICKKIGIKKVSIQKVFGKLENHMGTVGLINNSALLVGERLAG